MTPQTFLLLAEASSQAYSEGPPGRSTIMIRGITPKRSSQRNGN